MSATNTLSLDPFAIPPSFPLVLLFPYSCYKSRIPSFALDIDLSLSSSRSIVVSPLRIRVRTRTMLESESSFRSFCALGSFPTSARDLYDAYLPIKYSYFPTVLFSHKSGIINSHLGFLVYCSQCSRRARSEKEGVKRQKKAGVITWQYNGK